ncbi:hypothetical protein GCM10023189_50900 [Nibrella saemangeumensis]|uniref:N-acetyltransferase domain-containing protein n=1 Tax=Nibrella saemangeumensis TaxID=1084526 RepID=A0ABP8NKJ8_9BACT
MELLPIQRTLADNSEFVNHPDCQESLPMTIEFFDKVGYSPPWIGYVAREQDQLVGVGAFKGAPRDGQVEIAYGTFPASQQQGMGAKICRQLVELALITDPSIRITARTLPEENYSTKILRKNGFHFLGTVWDNEDGDVWEWEYIQ